MRSHPHRNWTRRNRSLLRALLLLGVLATSAHGAASSATQGLTAADFALIPEDSASVIVNLTGAMLRLVTTATRDSEPEISELVSRLDAVHVRLAPAEDLPDPDRVRRGLRELADRLRSQGWQLTVRTREDEGEISILEHRENGDTRGVAVLIFESYGEAGLILLTGEIDPTRLAVLAEGLRIEALGRAEHSTAPKDQP